MDEDTQKPKKAAVKTSVPAISKTASKKRAKSPAKRKRAPAKPKPKAVADFQETIKQVQGAFELSEEKKSRKVHDKALENPAFRIVILSNSKMKFWWRMTVHLTLTP